MPTLLLRLVGPMQSWGTSSRFDQRDTGKEPSKSGVIGILAAAMGIDRSSWEGLEPLTKLSMGVRHDRPGLPRRDYQTAAGSKRDRIIKADGTLSQDGVVSQRFYLADAAFLVGLEGEDHRLLTMVDIKLRDPKWPLSLGRKSYAPSMPMWIQDGIQSVRLREVLTSWPWIGTKRQWEVLPERLLISLESQDGTGVLRMDQPLSSFSERRFGARLIRSEWIPFPKEVPHVSQ